MAISLYLGFVLPANTLTTINNDLGPDPNYVLIPTSFTLVSGVMLLLVGRLSDIFGRRYFLIGGQLLGLIGAVVCATAKSIPAVIGGTVLTGFAGAVQLTFTFIVVELVPNKFRPLVNSGLFVATFPFAAFGPIIASAFVAHTAKGWRWNYYLNIITCGLSIILFALFYFPTGHEELRRGRSIWVLLRKLDFGGLVLYSGGLCLVLLGLSWGGSSYSWNSTHVITILVVGFASLIAFALYEICMPLEQPIIPTKLLRNTNYTAVVCSACVGTIIYFSFNVLWPEIIETLFTTDEIRSGWLACTTGMAVVVGEIAAGVLMAPIGHHRYQLVACTAAMTAFVAALAAINQYKESLAIALAILGGLGVGYQELICIIMVTLICEPEDIGLACGFLGSWKQVSGSIATAIYLASLRNRIKTTLPADVATATTSAGLPATEIPALLTALASTNSSAVEQVPHMTSKILLAVSEAMKTAYSQSFSTVFLVSIVFGVLAIVAAIFSKNTDARLNNEVGNLLEAPGKATEGETEKA